LPVYKDKTIFLAILWPPLYGRLEPFGSHSGPALRVSIPQESKTKLCPKAARASARAWPFEPLAEGARPGEPFRNRAALGRASFKRSAQIL
jgi:hypothetical protein